MKTNNAQCLCNFARYPILFIFAFLLDRLTKSLAISSLTQHESLPIINGLDFTLTFNRGLSWSILSFDSTTYFGVLTAFIGCIIALFVVYAWYEYRRGTTILPEVLVIAGALSNLLDRVLYGGVVDFIDCYVGQWHWPVFNVADICIVIGVLCIVKRHVWDS